MTEMRNIIIRASAGSGKTRALVRRLLQLLALGVPPERIVALTFTRKAAGEFFARLLQQLAQFAEDPRDAGGYLEEFADDTRARCLRLLRLLVNSMDRLRLGTLDSFFASMVQCLPFELGLAGGGTILSDQEQRVAREEALDALLVDVMRPGSEAARRELLEAWKQATLGAEGSSPARTLGSWFERLHGWHLECPDGLRWGDVEAIWTGADAPVRRAGESLENAAAELERTLPRDEFSPAARAKWEEFFRDIAAFHPGTPLAASVKYMLDPGRGEVGGLRAGDGEWKMHARKPVLLGPGASRALLRVLEIVVGREMKTRCERTRGLFSLVEIFEREYRKRVRGAGRLVFEDLTLLLSGRFAALGSGVWRERWAQLRLDLEYRLNARYDHWLFDEFQDTSSRQWRVFRDPVDEVIQDAEGRRAFFAVGDLKQSIYLWREAEPELFLGIERHYARRIGRETLSVSWRSCPEVLGMVNDVLGNASVIAEALPGAMDWWVFERHVASEKTGKLRGHAAVLEVASKEDKDAALTALLRQVGPLERGLSCAVLVRSNEEARRLAVLLRRELRCEVVCESAEAVAVDNPVTVALLSAIKLAAHPQDSLAWRHLEMTPLGGWLGRHGESREGLAAGTRREILRGGFLGAANLWIARLREVHPRLDAFSEWRLRQFLELCAGFDAGGGRDVDEFLRFARETEVTASGGSRALQVMTVHKSKGLEFDVVVLPDLLARSLDDARRETLLWSRGEDGEIRWLLERPPASVVDWDGALTADIRRLKDRAGFEGLCRLYVAMTRARLGLYVLLDAKGQVRSEVKIVRDAVGGDGAGADYPVPGAPAVRALSEKGARDWFERCERGVAGERPAPSSPEPAAAAPLGERLRRLNRPLQRRAPSGEETFRLRGSDLLSAGRESGRRMGTLVHELFAAVEWLEADAGGLERRWRADWGREPGFEEAARMVRGSLAQSGIREWFVRGEPARAVWRERSFDLLEDGRWISGQIDRVVLERDGSGKVVEAAVLDFKTDAVTHEPAMREKAEGYGPQMALYREAVSRLTGLEVQRVRVALVFVQPGRLFWLGGSRSPGEGGRRSE